MWTEAMPRNKNKRREISLRRQVVSELMVRCFTQEEATDELAKRGFKNKRTGEPYSRPTVAKDMMAIEDEARQYAKHSVLDHRARQLQELFAIKKIAWKGKKNADGEYSGNPSLFYVLECLKHEARILRLEEEHDEGALQGLEDFALGVDTAIDMYEAGEIETREDLPRAIEAATAEPRD